MNVLVVTVTVVTLPACVLKLVTNYGLVVPVISEFA